MKLDLHCKPIFINVSNTSEIPNTPPPFPYPLCRKPGGIIAVVVLVAAALGELGAAPQLSYVMARAEIQTQGGGGGPALGCWSFSVQKLTVGHI